MSSRTRSQHAFRTGVSSPVLVGRDHELAQLVACIEEPRSLAVIEGEAGVGKTRLIREALAASRPDDRPRLLGRAHPLVDPFPLGVVVEALEDGLRDVARLPPLDPITGALRPLLPGLAARLPVSPAPLGDPRAERHRIQRGVVSLLDSIGGVLVLEDLHWADRGTMELVPILLSKAPPGLSVVLSYRREELAPGSPLLSLPARLSPDLRRVTLRLGSLDADGIARLVSEILGAEDVSDTFARYLWERTSGLPFAMEEVLRLLLERRAVVVREGRWTRRAIEQLQVPQSVRDSVLERLERLSADTLAVVRAAAVLAEPASPATIRAVSGIPAARASRAVSGAMSAGILEDRSGDVVVRHVLARETIEEAIPPADRRAMHRRAARALGPSAGPARLARHLWEAGRPAQAARHAEEAADAAASLFDDDAARRLLERALANTPPRSPARRRLALKLSESAIQSLAHDEATSTILRIVEEEPLPEGVRGELRFNLGRLHLQSGEVADGVEQIERAVPELRRRPALQARAMSSLAYPWTARWTVPEHLSWLQRAVTTVARGDDKEAVAAVLVDRAAVLLGVADPHAWRAVLEVPDDDDASPAVARQRVRGELNVAISALALGHDAQAERMLDRGAALSERLGYARAAHPLACVRILRDWHAGRWDGLPDRAREIERADAAVPAFTIFPRLVRALLAAAAGDVEQAEGDLEELMGMCERVGGFFPLACVTATIASLRLDRGDSRGARESMLPVLEVIAQKDLWTYGAELLPPAVASLVRCGEGDRAAELVRQAARYLRGRDAPAPSAWLHEARAYLATAREAHRVAERGYARAGSAWRRMERPLPAIHALQARAALMEEESARRLLEDGLEAAAAINAERDAARIRASLRRLGVSFGHRRGRRGYGTKLSPREVQVARLVRDGHTNREIAEELFLSVRTVESHVASLIKKLEVGSRRELARSADHIP